MSQESPQVWGELRIHLGEGLTKQTLPHIVLLRRRTLRTKKEDSEVLTIESSNGCLDQESEPEIFREAMRALRAQEIDDWQKFEMSGQ